MDVVDLARDFRICSETEGGHARDMKDTWLCWEDGCLVNSTLGFNIIIQGLI